MFSRALEILNSYEQYINNVAMLYSFGSYVMNDNPVPDMGK